MIFRIELNTKQVSKTTNTLIEVLCSKGHPKKVSRKEKVKSYLQNPTKTLMPNSLRL